jgi:hypothetical protein
MKDEHEGYEKEVANSYRVEAGASSSALNSKVQAYMVAVLQNPRFFDWAAMRYGGFGKEAAPDLAVGPLAVAIFMLERELKDMYSHTAIQSRGHRGPRKGEAK